MTTRRILRNVRLVAFDFDGTIADTLTEALAAYNQAAADLGTQSISPTEMIRLRGMRPRDILRELRIPIWKTPSIFREVRLGMRHRIENARPFPGIDVAIRGLRHSGVRCAILSSNSADNILSFLKRNAIGEIDLIYAGASLFGKAKRLRGLLNRARSTPRESYYVGDEVRDVMAAKEAGMGSVAVTWGYNDRDALAAENPDILVDAPEQLRALLQG